MKTSNDKNLILIIGIVFTLIGLVFTYSQMPPISSAQFVTATITGHSRCSSSASGRSSKTTYSDSYKFTFNNQTYTGTGNVCSPSSNNVGKSKTIIFDEQDPDNHVPLSDLLFTTMFVLVGIILISLYFFIRKKEKSGANQSAVSSF